MWVESVAAMVKQLAALKTGYLDTGKMGLFQNNVNITPDTVIGDLTVATFDGYAPVTLTTWSAAFADPQQPRGVILTPTCTFTKSGTVTANDIWGYFLLDTDDVYMGAELFTDAQGVPTPIPMINAGQVIVVTGQKYMQNIAG